MALFTRLIFLLNWQFKLKVLVQIKLFQWMPSRHLGEWRYSCTYSYSQPYMEISVIPQLLYTQGNSLWYQLNRRLIGPRANLERTEVFCLCHELNHNSSSSLWPSHYTNWAILAPVKNIQKKFFLTKTLIKNIWPSIGTVDHTKLPTWCTQYHLFIKYYSPLHVSSIKYSSSGGHGCTWAAYGTVTLYKRPGGLSICS